MAKRSPKISTPWLGTRRAGLFCANHKPVNGSDISWERSGTLELRVDGDVRPGEQAGDRATGRGLIDYALEACRIRPGHIALNLQRGRHDGQGTIDFVEGDGGGDGQGGRRELMFCERSGEGHGETGRVRRRSKLLRAGLAARLLSTRSPGDRVAVERAARVLQGSGSAA